MENKAIKFTLWIVFGIAVVGVVLYVYFHEPVFLLCIAILMLPRNFFFSLFVLSLNDKWLKIQFVIEFFVFIITGGQLLLISLSSDKFNFLFNLALLLIIIGILNIVFIRYHVEKLTKITRKGSSR